MTFIVNNKPLYYILQFTWGLLTNLVGLFVFIPLAVFCLVFKKEKVKKFHNNFYIRIGKRWGGFSLGVFIVLGKDQPESSKYHESGHSLQNIVWGPLFPFVIGIPSATRWCYRYLTPKKKHPDYYSIWFEGQATEWGLKYFGGKK